MLNTLAVLRLLAGPRSCTSLTQDGRHAIPGSIEELDKKAVENGRIQLLLLRLLIAETVAVQQCGVQEMQDAVLTGGVHALLGSPCSAVSVYLQ